MSKWFTPWLTAVSIALSATPWVTSESAAAPKTARLLMWPVLPNGALSMPISP